MGKHQHNQYNLGRMDCRPLKSSVLGSPFYATACSDEDNTFCDHEGLVFVQPDQVLWIEGWLREPTPEWLPIYQSTARPLTQQQEFELANRLARAGLRIRAHQDAGQINFVLHVSEADKAVAIVISGQG